MKANAARLDLAPNAEADKLGCLRSGSVGARETSATLDANNADLFQDFDGMSATEMCHERHGSWVARFVRSLVSDSEDARDLTQEAFLYLWRREVSRGASPWVDARGLLITVVRHLCAEHGRKYRRQQPSGLLEEIEEPCPPEIASSGPHYRIETLLARLSPGEIEVVQMRILEKRATKSTAEALSIKEGTVRSRLHRALTKLRGTRSPK